MAVAGYNIPHRSVAMLKCCQWRREARKPAIALTIFPFAHHTPLLITPSSLPFLFPLSPYPPLPSIPSHLPVFPSQMRALSLWSLICPVTCPHMMPFSRSAASSLSSRMYILRALASFTKPALSGKV